MSPVIWPLRISRERAALYGGALIVAPLYQTVVNTLNTLPARSTVPVINTL
jgi:hypothetical protein